MSGTITPTFDSLSLNLDSQSGSTQAVRRTQADGLYAALNGSARETFLVENATVSTQEAIPIAQADGRYAGIGGSKSQAFLTANGVSDGQAVAINQFAGSLGNTATSSSSNSLSTQVIINNPFKTRVLVIIMGMVSSSSGASVTGTQSGGGTESYTGEILQTASGSLGIVFMVVICGPNIPVTLTGTSAQTPIAGSCSVTLTTLQLPTE